MLIYTCRARPRPIKDRTDMRTEIINEFILGLATHYMVIFTDFCSNMTFKFNSGYGYICIVIGIIILNLGQIVLIFAKQLVMRLKLKFQKSQNIKKFKREMELKAQEAKAKIERQKQYDIIFA